MAQAEKPNNKKLSTELYPFVVSVLCVFVISFSLAYSVPVRIHLAAAERN